MKVRKAVIPAAGLGTRMLPATKTVPKEMLPMVDKPVIQYIIEEAVAAGIEDILIVTNRAKSAMDDYFDYYPELETRLLQSGKESELVEVRRAADLANIFYVRQKETKGLGHAIGRARRFVGDPRVNILQPGPGVGGHCISVDPWFLVGDYPQLAKVIDESMKTNDSQPTFVLERIYEIMKENNITDNRKVGLYGLTYKENVDDFRESPALQLLDIQQRHLARPLKCYDPFLENHKIAENQFSDFDEFLKDVDMVVLMVKHDHIKHNWDRLKGKVILDCFNICPLEGVYHI